MPVTVTKLDAPSNVQANLQEGGSLAANTTYYVVVTAKNFSGGSHYYSPIDGELISEASEEISFTTTDTHKSAVITWTRPTGSTYYNVYMSTSTGDYVDYKTGNNTVAAGHRCGRSGNTQDGEIYDTAANTNTYTINQVGTLNTAYVGDTIGYGAIHDANNPNNIMGMIPKGNGTILVSFSGTYTYLKQICDELTAQGYGNYFYYNNFNLFILRGGIYIPATETNAGLLRIYNHTLIFFTGSIQNMSSTVNLQLGDYTNNNSKNGCVVGTNVLKIGNLKAYNTIFNSKLYAPSYPYSVYQAERSLINGSVTNAKDCFFYDYATSIYANLSNQYLFSKVYPLRTYIVNANDPSSAWRNVYIESPGVNPQWYAFFRECKFNITSPLYVLLTIAAPNRRIGFYDCEFIGDNFTTYNNHRHYWYESIGGTSEIVTYYNSIRVNVTDSQGNIISGANVELSDKNGNIALSTTTDSSGNTQSSDIMVYEIRHNPSTGVGYLEQYQLRTDYSPFTLMVSKEGYDDYMLTFTHNTKLDTTISLNETKPVVYYHQQLDGSINQKSLAGTINSSTISGKLDQETLQGSVVSTNLSGDIY